MQTSQSMTNNGIGQHYGIEKHTFLSWMSGLLYSATQAALEFLLQTGRQPDILHCHDWSTAGAAQAYWDSYHLYGLWRPKVVFTIHNAEYGLDRIGSAAYYSQRFTTVSPTYAFEVRPITSLFLHPFLHIFIHLFFQLFVISYTQFLPHEARCVCRQAAV